MSFLPPITTRGLVATIIAVSLAVAAFMVFTSHEQKERTDAAALWDAGQTRPQSIALLRRNDTDVTIATRQTIPPQEIHPDWCHCSMSRGGGGLGKTIMRYPTVHDLRSIYEAAKRVDRSSANQCMSYAVLNSVDELRVASTTDAITLTYSRDGRTLTFCFPNPEAVTDDDRLVTWSDQSPYGYP